MLHQLALLASVVIFSWLALHVAASAERRRLAAIGALALCAVLWSTGELLLAGASTPANVALARRVLFLGVCAVPPCWLWVAAVLGGGPERRAIRVLAAAVGLVELYFYSHLWWDVGGSFLDPTAVPPRHGPLFPVHAALSWLAIVGGLIWVIRRSIGQRAARRHRALLALAVLVPLGVNVAYVCWGSGLDPTPIVLAGSALVVRVTLMRSGLSSVFVPFGDRALLDRLTVGVLVADRRGIVLGANERAQRLLGSLRPEGSSLDAVLDFARNEPGRSLDVHRFPLDDPDGRAECALLSERAGDRWEAEKVDLGALRDALVDLSARLSHEVNNPLTYLTVNLHLLRPLLAELARSERELALPDALEQMAHEGPELLEACAEGAERIQRVIEKLDLFRRCDSDAELRHLLTLWRSTSSTREWETPEEDRVF